MEASQFSAVVLAAGHSSRFGTDKALLEVEGVPLWQRQRDVLVNAGAAEIFLSARPDQRWTRDADGFAGVLHDALPGCGPIIGITAALERAAHPWVAVLAIDLPAMSTRWFQHLLSQCERRVGAVGIRDNIFEPLAAIYPRDVMWHAWEAIVRADYSLQRLLTTAVNGGKMRVVEIPDGEVPAFTNVNRPADWAVN